MRSTILGSKRAESRERTITARDLLTGSSFSLATGTADGGAAGLWGRGTASRFSGIEDDLSLDGEVLSTMLGADWTREPWTAGFVFSHTRGTGDYQGPDHGRIASDLTGVYPYAQHTLHPRLSVWGLAGYGVGSLTLTPDGSPALKTDIDLAMAAIGARSTLLEPGPQGGPGLAATSDLLGVRTTSSAVRDEHAGNLEAARTHVSRIRLGLEGTWPGIRVGIGSLTPSLEIGVRGDGGNAETGVGVDAGAGFDWHDLNGGITASIHARGLLIHEADGFQDSGLSASLGWDPRPDSARGPTVRLVHEYGAAATGGMNALLSRPTLDDRAEPDGTKPTEHLALDVGYGVPALGGLLTLTPELGLGLSEDDLQYRLGLRLNTATPGPATIEVHIEARTTRTKPATTLGLAARW